MDLHVIHVVRDLDVASGGPSRSVPALAESQAWLPGVTVEVRYRNRGKAQVELAESPVRYHPTHGLFSKVEDSNQTSRSTVFHLHGLWSPSLHHAARAARPEGIPYLVSIRGMLADWAMRHRPLRKRVAWGLYQQSDLQRLIHGQGSPG